MTIEELAACVANDVAEGIDNGESRKELRAIIRYYAQQEELLVQRVKGAEIDLMAAQIAAMTNAEQNGQL